MKDRIERIKNWIQTNPNETMLILIATSVGAQLVYFGYAVTLDRTRTHNAVAYRKAVEKAIESGKDVRVYQNGTIEVLTKKSK